jgi:hypothetical protein
MLQMKNDVGIVFKTNEPALLILDYLYMAA